MGGIPTLNTSGGTTTCTQQLQEITNFKDVKVLKGYDTPGFENQKNMDTLQDIKQTQYNNKTLQYLIQGRLGKTAILSRKKGQIAQPIDYIPQIYDRMHVIIFIFDIQQITDQKNITMIFSFLHAINQQPGRATFIPLIILTKMDMELKQQNPKLNDQIITFDDIYLNYQHEIKTKYDKQIKIFEDYVTIDNIFPFINYGDNEKDTMKQLISYKIIQKILSLGQQNIEQIFEQKWIIKVELYKGEKNKVIGVIDKLKYQNGGEYKKTQELLQVIQEEIRKNKLTETCKLSEWCFYNPNHQNNYLKEYIDHDDNEEIDQILDANKHIVLRIKKYENQ